jgi:hypothetical protein
VLRGLNKLELENVLERLKILISEVDSNGFRELQIENTIDFAVAAGDCLDLLEPWSKGRGFKPGACGPPIESDEVQRLIENKIKRKQSQLPKDRPGIIVVNTTNTMLFHVYPIDYIAGHLQQSLKRFPHLLAVAIYGRYGGGSKNLSSANNRLYYAERIRDDIIYDERMLIWNPAFNQNISDNTVKLISNAMLGSEIM